MNWIAGRFTAGLVGPRAVRGPVRPESPVGRAADRLRNTPVSRPTEPLMSDQPAPSTVRAGRWSLRPPTGRPRMAPSPAKPPTSSLQCSARPSPDVVVAASEI